ncbi:hypothetical protein [Thermomonas carbonis]|uniref:DUF2007 domain-containing protein n=1 Tax=Thermomonas carbonis TaxID=1463158 RepID=A0A7G9SQX7_9GAMM|nr:hypothetical protein [Thermomonas carbonis]QNN70252.1 hypothetical protein H9L16_00970 [Thermomonas carbonis]GHB98752.1 hypothetical protein GCM10010080_09150 [Thermomonas carbonis]
MRQVFTSPRLENVEAVAGLLRAEGIEVRITNDRSYRGQRRSHFSYREDEEAPSPKPAVWIVNADEQPRARQLLRDAGLLDSSRDGTSSYLPLSALNDPAASAQEKKAKRKVRIRLGLLVVILVAIGFTIFGTRTPSPAVPAVAAAKPAPPPADIIPQSAEELSVYRVDMPTALAKRLVEETLATRKPAQACIAIDGRNPSPAFLQSLAAGNATLSASTACVDGATRISVSDYMTDGSGSGKATVQVDDDAARSLAVERDGTAWRILDAR